MCTCSYLHEIATKAQDPVEVDNTGMAFVATGNGSKKEAA